MRRHFHDTTNERGAVINAAERKAKTQDDQVREFYRDAWPSSASPSQVQKSLGLENVPLTSIRRAISNLTRDGHLVKTSNKVRGVYGRSEFTWQFNRLEPTKQASLF